MDRPLDEPFKTVHNHTVFAHPRADVVERGRTWRLTMEFRATGSTYLSIGVMVYAADFPLEAPWVKLGTALMASKQEILKHRARSAAVPRPRPQDHKAHPSASPAGTKP